MDKRESTVKWSIFEMIWFIIAVGTVTLVAIINKNDSAIDTLSNIAAVCGVVYVILIAKQDKIAYFFGIANVICYAIAAYNKQLYAGAAYNMLYSFPMMIYGFIYWKRNEKSDNLGIQTLHKKTKIIMNIALVGAIVVMSLFLNHFGGSLCILDATAAVTAFLGMYLMTNKYMEQWSVWIIGNIAGAVMWGIFTFQDNSNLGLCVMWIIYTLNSIYGFSNWKRISKI